MSDQTPYTPSLDEARERYAWGVSAFKLARPYPGAKAEFDRLIAQVRAEAWDEGMDSWYATEKKQNPYREGSPTDDEREALRGEAEKVQRAAWAKIHGQDPTRTYSVAEVKQLVYSFDNVLSALLRRSEVSTEGSERCWTAYRDASPVNNTPGQRRAFLAGFRRSEVPEPSAGCPLCGATVTDQTPSTFYTDHDEECGGPLDEPQGEPSAAQVQATATAIRVAASENLWSWDDLARAALRAAGGVR